MMTVEFSREINQLPILRDRDAESWQIYLMQHEHEPNENEKTIATLKSKWDRVAPLTNEQLTQMVADFELANKLNASRALIQDAKDRKTDKLTDAWHSRLLHFTKGRFNQAIESEGKLEQQAELVRAAQAKHDEALTRLEKGDFALRLDLDQGWLDSKGEKGCPNFSMLVAFLGDRLTSTQTELVESHFDQCTNCCEKVDADPSMSGYFPPYEITN